MKHKTPEERVRAAMEEMAAVCQRHRIAWDMTGDMRGARPDGGWIEVEEADIQCDGSWVARLHWFASAGDKHRAVLRITGGPAVSWRPSPAPTDGPVWVRFREADGWSKPDVVEFPRPGVYLDIGNDVPQDAAVPYEWAPCVPPESEDG